MPLKKRKKINKEEERLKKLGIFEVYDDKEEEKEDERESWRDVG